MDAPLQITSALSDEDAPVFAERYLEKAPALWPHQQAALQRMIAFESMVRKKAGDALMPPTTPRGILATPPGSGKTRIALALCMTEPSMRTVIVVLPHLLHHWLSELDKLGIHPGDATIEVITNMTAHNLVDASIHGCRLIYDETEALKNAKGRPLTRFAHEAKTLSAISAKPAVIWLMDGTHCVNDYVVEHVIPKWSLTEGVCNRQTVRTFPAQHKTTRLFGVDYYPINLIQCSTTFITESQQLNLQAPVLTKVKINDETKHLLFLQGANLMMVFGEDLQASFESIGSTIINNVADHCAKARCELQAQVEECRKLRQCFENDLLTESISHLTIAATGGNEPPETTPTTVTATVINDIRSKEQAAEASLRMLDKLENNKEKCAICWAEEVNAPCALTPCCYSRFCYYCIKTWVSLHQQCPMCRASLRWNQIILHHEPDMTPNTNDAMHSMAALEQYAILPARDQNKKILLYMSSSEECETLRTIYGRDLCTYPVEDNDTLPTSVFQADNGKGQILFLTDKLGVKGLNLCMADHLVITAPVTAEKRDQLVGRAQRPGRRVNHILQVYLFCKDAK